MLPCALCFYYYISFMMMAVMAQIQWPVYVGFAVFVINVYAVVVEDNNCELKRFYIQTAYSRY